MKIRMGLAITCALLFLALQPFCRSQATGQIPYIAKCAGCHGMKGLADTQAGKTTNARPFNDPTVVAMSDTTLLGIIENGSGKMPAYKSKISDDEANKMIQYIHLLQSAK